jgi:hypothetical protein
MRPAKTIPKRVGEGDKGGSEFNYYIYCKNFCKCHNAPQYNHNDK